MTSRPHLTGGFVGALLAGCVAIVPTATADGYNRPSSDSSKEPRPDLVATARSGGAQRDDVCPAIDLVPECFLMPAEQPTADAISIVVLGDSDATGHGDPTGQGWVGRYADLVRESTDHEVDVRNRAVDGTTSLQLLSRVETDESLRDELAGADIVAIGIGGADLNHGDELWASGACEAEACYADDLAAFAHNIDAVVDVVAQLRTNEPTVLRAITLPNAVPGAADVIGIPDSLVAEANRVSGYQASSLRQSICAAMGLHGGQCVDVLTVFNGPDGTADAYELGLMNKEECCYPSGEGQQLMAELLIATGLDARPLTSTSAARTPTTADTTG